MMKKKITQKIWAYFNQQRKAAMLCFALITTFQVNLMAQAPTCQDYGNATASGIVYQVNGSVVAGLAGNVSSGDEVSVTFSTGAGTEPTMFALVSYIADGALFDAATAYKQVVNDSEIITSTPGGTHTLTVTVPDCYFQVDFILGCIITRFGPEGTNNFYSPQGRLIAGVNGGMSQCPCAATADAGMDQELNCISTQLTLIGTAGGSDLIYSWTTIEGNIVSGSETALPIVNAGGTYIFTVSDTIHNCFAVDEVVVTSTADSVDASAGGSMVINCILSSVMLGGSTTTSGATYLWTTANGNIVSGSATLTPTVDAAGTYNLRVTNPVNGCFAEDVVTVTFDLEAPMVSIDDINVCSGSSPVVLDAGNLGASFSWSTGAITQVITVLSGGSFTVTVTNANGCTASDAVGISYHPNPIIDIITRDTMYGLCVDTILLDVETPGATFTWSTGGVSSTLRVTASGTYYVTATAAFGCVAVDSVSITMVDRTFIVELGDTLVSTGCVTLHAGLPGAIDYQWCDGSEYPDVRVCTTGYYCVTVTTPSGCYAKDSVYVIILPAVDLGADIVNAEDSVVLDAGTAGNMYLWSTGEVSKNITITQSGSYWVNVSNHTGYLGSDTISVIFREANPSAITISPVKDNFIVSPNPNTGEFQLNLESSLSEYRNIKIVNYLGEEVYSLNLNNDNLKYLVDISHKAAGVYFIILQGKDTVVSRKMVKLK